MRGLAHSTLLAAVGHLEFIGNTCVFTYRPIREFRSQETPLTAYYAGPSDTLVGQPIVFPMGQSKPIV
jgi:hypothetical protein